MTRDEIMSLDNLPPDLSALADRPWHKLTIFFDYARPAPPSIACACLCGTGPIVMPLPERVSPAKGAVLTAPPQMVVMEGSLVYDPGDRIHWAMYIGACPCCPKVYYCYRPLPRTKS